MEVSFGLITLVGKFLFLALVYAFLYWAFRGLFSQAAAEFKAQARPAPAPALQAVPAPKPAPVVAAQPAVAVAPPVPAPVQASVSRPRATLLVKDQGQSTLTTGQVIDLAAAITIGRAEDNGLVIDDKFCSTHHALIFLQAGQRLLRDRNSTNGTFYNGQRVTSDITLSDGDEISIGTVVLKYQAATA